MGGAGSEVGRRPPTPRLLRDSKGWFSEGSDLKAAARRSGRCVECRRALDSRRSPYCSRRCQWSFRGRFFWDAARTFVMYRDRYTCRACRRRFRVAQLEVDHIFEVARGGAALDYLNLQTLCRGCHRSKTIHFLRTRPPGIAGAPGAEGPDPSRPQEWGADWFPS